MIAAGGVHRVEKEAAVEAVKNLYSNLKNKDAIRTQRRSAPKKLALARVTNLTPDLQECIGKRLDTIWDCEKDGHRFSGEDCKMAWAEDIEKYSGVLIRGYQRDYEATREMRRELRAASAARPRATGCICKKCSAFFLIHSVQVTEWKEKVDAAQRLEGLIPITDM